MAGRGPRCGPGLGSRLRLARRVARGRVASALPSLLSFLREDGASTASESTRSVDRPARCHNLQGHPGDDGTSDDRGPRRHPHPTRTRERHPRGRVSRPLRRSPRSATAPPASNGRHNFEVVEQAIALYKHGSAGTKSRAELAFVLKAAGLPEFHTNVHVEDIEVDFHWPELQLVVEIDGPHHGRPSTRREDKLKSRILQQAGYEVLRFKDTDPPERIVAAVSARRPRPSSSCASRPA